MTLNEVPSDADSDIRKILDFWFGDNDGETVPERQTDMWFRNGRDYDHEIREQFADLIDCAAAGAFDAWCQSGTGRLALIVLLDQFPRHVHRNHARAFAYDAKAREHCLAGLAQAQASELSHLQRATFYLPLEHAENRALQERAVALYQALANAVTADNHETYANYVLYASMHRDFIVRFGHFPHRNELIGRPLSAEQQAFLLEPNSSFL